MTTRRTKRKEKRIKGRVGILNPDNTTGFTLRVSAMNELERNAYGAIAQGLAWHVHDFSEDSCKEFPISEKFPSEAKAIYHHFSTSDFERVADNLWRLQILRPLDEQNGWAYYFVMNCEPSDSYQMAISNWQSGPPFNELLLTFVTLFGDYGTEYWGFSTQQGVPFGKDGRLAFALDALAPLGYLEVNKAGYIWTAQIEPIMSAAGFTSGASEISA
jgi:hypothetical protein